MYKADDAIIVSCRVCGTQQMRHRKSGHRLATCFQCKVQIRRAYNATHAAKYRQPKSRKPSRVSIDAIGDLVAREEGC
jgi:hypothetical protein